MALRRFTVATGWTGLAIRGADASATAVCAFPSPFWSVCPSQRRAGTWVDPWSTRDEREEHPDENTVYEHNLPKMWYGKVGDPKKGLADDTRESPFRGLMAGVSGIDVETGTVWWAYDFTGGQIENNLQNAMLSNDTKTQIYLRHIEDPEKWTIEELAKEYRIRQQRVLAIIALKEMEHKMYNEEDEEGEREKEEQAVGSNGDSTPQASQDHETTAAETEGSPKTERPDEGEEGTQAAETEEASSTEGGKESDKEWKKRWLGFCEWLETDVYNMTATRGSGERHVLNMPTYPRFEEVGLEDADKHHEWEISRINHEMAERQEMAMVKEFRERLLLNMGKVGVSLRRDSRKPLFSSPPKKSMPLLVTPLGREHQHPYVANEDGSTRRPTEDEFMNWRRKNRWAVSRKWRSMGIVLAGGQGMAGDAEGGGAEAGSAEGGSAEGGSAEGGNAEGGGAEGGGAEGGSAEGRDGKDKD